MSKFLDKGNKVEVKQSTHPGAMDKVGEQGKVISCNPQGAYGVEFPDGQVWFYRALDLKAV